MLAWRCVARACVQASHNRFEHSLGVSFLAGVFAEKLRKNHPELGITEEEVLCCKVAGLCHDLGHGVMSHAFDAFVRSRHPDWSHEKGSLLMLDHLLQQNPGVSSPRTLHFDGGVQWWRCVCVCVCVWMCGAQY